MRRKPVSDTLAGMIKALGTAATCTFLLALLGAAIAGYHARSGARKPGPSIRALTATDPATEPADHPATTDNPQQTQWVGAALNLYHTDRIELYHDALTQMKEAGFNAVQIVTPIFQVDGASQQVELEQGPNRGPALEDIASLLNHAKRLGIATMLMPQVNFTNPRGNEWRGKLQPEHWAPWWDSYTRAIDQFLDTAIENDVDLFVVGCELLTTHNPEHEARWRELIAHCRGRFDGRLTYSTTWDTYHKVTYWDALDTIGVSGYWDITTLAQDSGHPTPDELERRWLEIKQRLLAYADSQGRPVLLTEVGYPSLPWALKNPWNYINSDHAEPDHDAQASGYAAFIAAWSDTIHPPTADPSTTVTPMSGDPRSRGVVFHKWDPYHQGGPDDTGYGVAGKPAYQLLTGWLR